MISREPRVMLLCEDAVYRSVLLRQFEKEGWDVGIATHPEDAERKAVQFRPHILFFEMRTLAEAERLLHRAKTLPTLLRTRVIVEAATLRPGEAERIVAAGAATVVMRGHQTPADIVRLAGKELS